MNIEELKAAIADGTIKMDDVINEVKAAGHVVTETTPASAAAAPTGTEPAKTAAPAPAATELSQAEIITAAVKAATEPLMAQVAELKSTVGALPGGTVKSVASRGDDLDIEPTDLEKFNKTISESAASGEALRITGK